MSTIISGKDIQHSIEDTFLLPVTSESGFSGGDKLRFDITDNENNELLISKTFSLSGEAFDVVLTKDEKAKLKIGDYIYRIIITSASGTIITEVSGNFILTWGVGCSSNKSTLVVGKSVDHSKMSNLSYEASGHTGFQKELTTEQLENIDAIPNKVDKEEGKGLSSNDFTNELKEKLTSSYNIKYLGEMIYDSEDIETSMSQMNDIKTPGIYIASILDSQAFVYLSVWNSGTNIEQTVYSFDNLGMYKRAYDISTDSWSDTWYNSFIDMNTMLSYFNDYYKAAQVDEKLYLKADKGSIPTKLSDLEDDSGTNGFRIYNAQWALQATKASMDLKGNPILNYYATKSELKTAESIAKGRATGYVFDTLSDLETWLEDSENTSKLVLGDNLYIRATDVPDYWWDGAEKQILETQKVDLSEYATKAELTAAIGEALEGEY